MEGEGVSPPNGIIMLRVIRMPLDLMIRPVARIIRELPPSL